MTHNICMTHIGYPADKISILTTYNGQKHLIRDVIENRCANNPLIGRPSKVTTVDRFQGQQNDYILLSLVRTKTVGHIRDVRRLIVAMSRARLGLYIFGRIGLFQNCFELGPALRLLTCRPNKLVVAPDESFPAIRPFGKAPRTQPMEMNGMSAMHKLVYKMYMDKIEEMEDDKEKMKELSEMLENPQDMEEDEPEPENEPQDLIQNEVPDTQVPNKHQQPADEPMET
jgi:intron-binding protein aquarius